MGWGGGGEIASGIVDTIEKNVVSHKDRVNIYKDVILTLEGHDWDQLDEAIDLSSSFNDALEELYPEMFEDWEDE
jgi:hypothetical protein